MKNFFTQIANIWNHEELRQKLGITLGLILVYRVGSFIVIPGVNSDVLAEQLAASGSGGLGDLLSLFTGGAFTRASIFALGIMPYISASIIVQLLGIAVPAVQKMQAEGESGRKKINQYTRFLTIAITLVQAPGYLATSVVGVPGAVANPTTFWWFSAVLILVCSTLVIMWLGERITDKGVGNGISLLIMIGIIATFPQALIQEFAHPDTTLFFFLVEVAFLLIVIGASVALVQALRKGAGSDGEDASGRNAFATRRRRSKLHPIESEFGGSDANHLCASHHVCATLLDTKRDIPRKRGIAELVRFQRILVQCNLLRDDCSLHVFLHGDHGQPQSDGG